MELPITRRFIGALLLILFALTADFAHAAVGRTPGTATVSPDGEAVYSIPLNLPQGTNGMTPTVALEYRRRSIVGLLCIGWNIGGLSQIARCPRTIVQDGVASPVTQTAEDRFCLDGQRLVVTNGVAYGAARAEYRTEMVSSMGQCNTICSNSDQEGGVYGATRTTRALGIPEGGPVATMESRAVIK